LGTGQAVESMSDEGDGSGVTLTRKLKFSPLPALMSAKGEALRYFCQRDLVGEDAGPLERLWELPEVKRTTATQLPSGAWRYPGGRPQIRSQRDYDQLETFRVLRVLVEKHGMNRESLAIKRAAEFLFLLPDGGGGLPGDMRQPIRPLLFGCFHGVVDQGWIFKRTSHREGFQVAAVHAPVRRRMGVPPEDGGEEARP